MIEHMAHKAHLSRFPMLPEYLPQPLESPSKRAIVLISIFDGQAGLDYPGHHVAHSALWSRHTWLNNTDATEHGVQVKLYVEEKTKEQALPVFIENGVDLTDIIWFDGTEIEGAMPYDLSLIHI